MIVFKGSYSYNKKGVTLIESMIAISIAAFLAASTIPNAMAAVNKAKEIRANFNTRMLLAGIDTYSKKDEDIEDIFDEYIIKALDYDLYDRDLSNVAVENIIRLSAEKNPIMYQDKKLRR